MSDEDVHPLLLPHEVAAMMRVSLETVRRWSRNGKLPVIVLPGGTYRYREADVRKIMEGQ